MLHTEASFCIYNVEDGCEDERRNEEAIERSGEFSFGGKTELIEEEEQAGLNGIQTLSLQGEVADSGEADADADAYKRTLPQQPDSCNDYNYAKFLQGNLQGAEEYYRRAMLADPADGQIISQYANLVWELHHDRDKCLQFFERAIQATPGDSNVLAAYASFLWETSQED